MNSEDARTKAELCFNEALELEDSGELHEALRACETALELAPDLADAYNLRAVVLEALGRQEEALESYAQAIGVDQGFKEAVDNMLALEHELGIDRSLVTIATFSHPLSAYVPQTKLESEGIRSFLADETIILLNWLYSLALGGVKLQVMAKDVKRAQEILTDYSDQLCLSEDEQPCCPECGSQSTRYHRYNPKIAFASWLLLGVLIPFPMRKWKCSKCGHDWKAHDRLRG